MRKLFTFFILILITTAAKSQVTTTSGTRQFGDIDKADLEMKACDFEKDANAEVLFDKGSVYFNHDYEIIFERHRRIKILNDNAKDMANVRLVYFDINHAQHLNDVQAETINLQNGAITTTVVDKKQIFSESVDKYRSALVFAFPNVKAGSVIEFKFRLTSSSILNFPDWYFQSDIPTRYSEITTDIPFILSYKNLVNVHYPFVVDKVAGANIHTQALANIPSLKDEPYMGARNDNSERILFQLISVRLPERYSFGFQETWNKVAESVLYSDDFGSQLNRKLPGEETILAKVKSFKTDDDKIAYLFNSVKNSMTWNGIHQAFTNDGTTKAWEKRTGNSAEINLALYRLLHKAGLKVYPMMVSTRSNGRVNPAYPNSYQFNSTVSYIPVDSAKYYILDASNKYNLYNRVPQDLLNTFGFYINNDEKDFNFLFMQDEVPMNKVIMLNAEIKPEGKMTGDADISSFGYNRASVVSTFKKEGEKKFTEDLAGNGLKITSLKMEDIDVDSLPAREKITFDLDLSSSDGNYIYFTPNLFTGLNTNPFLSEDRKTDIDFGYRDNCALTGMFKIPHGYAVEAMPKSITMSTPDNSIVFKRTVAEQDGAIMVRFNIDYKKTLYFKEDYPEFYEFCKKLHEMLSENVVLKKS
ncbi:DUF3857 domain-containing protein [Mucilaginibacter angelicae]|uniref:DUF3857 domain-containing protein n=1 Tax=Mucilaginibacter angelicae TaxID=869718 RepID=A0ABV6LHS7_9SPHI